MVTISEGRTLDRTIQWGLLLYRIMIIWATCAESLLQGRTVTQ